MPPVALPPTQKIDQYTKDSSIFSFLIVPPRREVHDGEENGHRRRDEQDGFHRLLPFLLGVESPPVSTVVIGEWLAAVESHDPDPGSRCRFRVLARRRPSVKKGPHGSPRLVHR